jgi:small subunit ribosomal protein S21
VVSVGLVVESRPGESVDRALRRFKKVVERAGVLTDVRARQWYLSPGEKRRAKTRAAAVRRRKTTRAREQQRRRRQA